MAATLKDVAKLAGVSVATASMALNGRGSLRPATRERILEAVRKLEYRPSAVARSLVMQRTRTIGLLIPDLGDPYYLEIYRGIEAGVKESEYTLLMTNTDRTSETERKSLDVLLQQRVDGIIFAGAGIDNDKHLMDLVGADLPLVLIGRHQLPFPTLLPENMQGALEAVTYLVRLGHRYIAHITGPEGFTTTEDRLEGYSRALKLAQLPVEPGLIVQGDFTPEGGLAATRRLLDGPIQPTAIFCGNDQMAIGVLQGLYQAGISVPRDISVVGFGDIKLSRFTIPPLTTVRMPIRGMGIEAGRLLLALLRGETVPSTVQIPVELVARGSTAPPTEQLL